MKRHQRVIALLALLSASCVFAQDEAVPAEGAAEPAPIPVQDPVPQQEPAADAEPAETRQRLDDIVVTATKREKSVREIPVSINAMYGEDLEKQGARDLKDYITQVPGITMQEGATGEAGDRKITIRGVGPGQLAGQAGNQTVGQFIGDVPMTDPYANFVAPDLDPYDLKTVEILKGPQGTTFGASALNGAIRYVPNTPELEKFSARGFVERLSLSEGGSDFTYAAAVNAPMGEHVALRGVGVLQNTPGLYDNLQRDTPDADSRRKWSGRGMARWDPTERSTTTFLFQKQHSHYDDFLVATNGDGEYSNDRQPGPSSMDIGFDLMSLDTRYEFDGWGTLVVQGSMQHKSALVDYDPGATGNLAIGALLNTAAAQIPGGGLPSLPLLLDPTASLALESIRGYGDYKPEGWTGEVRLVSPDDGNWNWIVGFFMQSYRIDAMVDLYIANTSAVSFLSLLPGDVFTSRGLSVGQVNANPTARETSLYGELTRKLGERWEVTAGARFYNTEMHGSRSVSGLLSNTYVSGKSTPIEQDERGISPKLSVTYKPWDNIMTYATLARGFQFGGANPPPMLSLPFNNPATGVPVPADFKSSVLWSRELGVRTDWFERTLRIDMTVFDLDWSRAQFSQSSGGGVYTNTYTDNVGKVRSQGVEATVTYLTPIPGLTMNIAGSYIHSRTAADYDKGDGDIVSAGTDMPATPRVQTVGSLTYNQSLGPWLAGASLMHVYWGKAYSNIEHEYTIYDFTSLNGNLSVSRPDWPGLPALTLGITNITDNRPLMNRAKAPVSNADTWTYGRPQAISLRLSAEFN